MRERIKIEMILSLLDFLSMAAINFIQTEKNVSRGDQKELEQFILNCQKMKHDLGFEYLNFNWIESHLTTYFKDPNIHSLDNIKTCIACGLSDTKYPNKINKNISRSLKMVYKLPSVKVYTEFTNEVKTVPGIVDHEFNIKEYDLTVYEKMIINHGSRYKFLINKNPQELLDII